MRPRFANRGSGPEPTSSRPGGRCFNEAPIRESGKFGLALDWTHQHSRFNEAPIRESGKSGQSCRQRGAGTGFNEAPIRESGKSTQYRMG